MSNTKSPSRSRSRSRSRSFSRSRTRSRSRSRKHGYSSRSRSRSRSHSASYSHDRNYPKESQSSRGFHGYNRGYRRPYYYRGRGRGFFPRGRYQRGGAGYGAYRHNNWQDYRGRQQQTSDQEPHSSRRGHSRSHSRTPRKRSRSRSRCSNRYSSDHSCRSSSSFSRSSSPKHCSKGAKDTKCEPKQTTVSSCTVGPPRASPQLRSAIVVSQGASASSHTGPSPSAATSSSVASWKSISPLVPGQSPPQAALVGTFSSFSFFSKDSLKTGEKSTILPAFKRFLAEHQNKKGFEWERDLSPGEGEKEREAAKPTVVAHSGPKAERKPLFLDTKGEPHEPLVLWPRGAKQWAEQKSEASSAGSTLPAEGFTKWEESVPIPTARDVPHPDGGVGDDLEDKKEELYGSSKRERAAVVTRRERAAFVKDSCPDQPPKDNRKERATESRNWEEEVLGCGRIPYCYDLASCTDTLARERRLCRDLVHCGQKEQEFHSIFQHIETAQLQQSPSELFAQHIVTIVHHIKARHPPPQEMTLHERFSLYQRQAAEQDPKPRKSPEIHRRIDISPSTFKKHFHILEEDAEMKERRLLLDLQGDLEQTVSYSSRDQEHRGVSAKVPAVSSVSSDKPTKHHKKSKKSKKKRSRSSSSSSRSYQAVEHPLQDGASGAETMKRAYVALGDHDITESSQDRKSFFGMKSREWDIGNYSRNHSNSDPPDTDAAERPPEVEWDPEYMPKSKKYCLHDDRGGYRRWLEHRPYGQGQLPHMARCLAHHKGSRNSKRSHNKFPGTMEEGELQDGGELDPPEEGLVALNH